MEYTVFNPTSHKIKAVIYGASGSGKTYFTGTAPNPFYCNAENGLLTLFKRGMRDIKGAKITCRLDLEKALQRLQKNDEKFETVIIDSISEINDILKGELEKKRGGSMELKDWNVLESQIKGILRGFRDLDMHVIFIAQEKTEKDDQKTEKIVPELNGKAATTIARYMDTVAYTYIDKGGNYRITMQPNEKLLTKNRGVDFVGDAPEDFKIWIEEIGKMALGEEKIVNPDPVKPVVVKKAPLPKDISTDLLTEWRRYYETTGKDPKNSLPTLSATLRKEYAKASVNELDADEAIKLIERLKAKNKEIKETKKEENYKQQLIDLEKEIAVEKEQYQIGCEHPTDTDQFRTAQENQRKKISEMELKKENLLKKIPAPEVKIESEKVLDQNGEVVAQNKELPADPLKEAPPLNPEEKTIDAHPQKE